MRAKSLFIKSHVKVGFHVHATLNFMFEDG